MGPRNHVLDGGPGPPWVGVIPHYYTDMTDYLFYQCNNIPI